MAEAVSKAKQSRRTVDLQKQISQYQTTLQRVEDLIPYAMNARTHSDAQIALLAGSMREFGFTNPVLTDGNRGIIAGHGRVLAARKLGLVEIPTVNLAHLTDDQRRAYIIADNRLAEFGSTWHEDTLASELGSLAEDGFDLKSIGYDDADIKKLLGEDFNGKSEEPGASSAKEIDPDGYELGHRCPRRGFEFDGDR